MVYVVLTLFCIGLTAPAVYWLVVNIMGKRNPKSKYADVQYRLRCSRIVTGAGAGLMVLSFLALVLLGRYLI